MSEGRRHRLNDLLGMHVRYADGTDGDRVLDVRLVPGDRLRGQLDELVTEGMVVGRSRPGTLFGYDRHPRQGPWLIRVVVRAMHRRSGYLEWRSIDHIDWDAAVVHLNVNQLSELAPRRQPHE